MQSNIISRRIHSIKIKETQINNCHHNHLGQETRNIPLVIFFFFCNLFYLYFSIFLWTDEGKELWWWQWWIWWGLDMLGFVDQTIDFLSTVNWEHHRSSIQKVKTRKMKIKKKTKNKGICKGLRSCV